MAGAVLGLGGRVTGSAALWCLMARLIKTADGRCPYGLRDRLGRLIQTLNFSWRGGVSKRNGTPVPRHRLSGITPDSAEPRICQKGGIESHSHAQRALPIARLCSALIEQPRGSNIRCCKQLIATGYKRASVHRQILRFRRRCRRALAGLGFGLQH
jgi:hypothetical protein